MSGLTVAARGHRFRSVLLLHCAADGDLEIESTVLGGFCLCPYAKFPVLGPVTAVGGGILDIEQGLVCSEYFQATEDVRSKYSECGCEVLHSRIKGGSWEPTLQTVGCITPHPETQAADNKD